MGETASTAVPVVAHSFPGVVRTTEAHVVRVQDAVALRPMSLEEAIKEAEFRDRDVFVFRDGITAARRSAELQVVKVGLERFIYTAAHERPFLYGLSAVAFASFAGWLAGAVWRRR